MKNLIIPVIIAVIVISTLYSCQKIDEKMHIELSTDYAQGQDGFKYVLTKNEFLTPFDIPIAQLQTIYGEETEIADWNDLIANFDDDFTGFLEDIGLSDYEKHQGFFIKNDSQYLFMGKRPYMVTGMNNQHYSSGIFLDKRADSGLGVAAQFDAGRVLLKMPKSISNH